MSGSGIDLLSITTPLPATSFVVTGFSGAERLSQPFGYTVTLSSGTALLEPNSLLDQPVCVKLGDDATGRYFHGIVSGVTQMPSASGTLWQYQLTVVPRLWFLGQTKASRFFHNQTAPAIVEAILDKFGVAYQDVLQGSYSTRVYTVQHNESYLHFIQRLLENEGIFYFFAHTDSAHTMVLADQKTAFNAIATPNLTVGEQTQGSFDLFSWSRHDETALGNVTVDDYNPETGQLSPGAVRGTAPTVLTAAGAPNRTFYDYPAGRDNSSDAGTLATWRIQAAEAGAQSYAGTGGATSLVAGGKFTLTNDPTGGGGSADYVLHEVSYAVTDTADGNSGGGAASNVQVSCSAFPYATQWRETPSAEAPSMCGIYTAQVIGPAGEEIYTDDLGRIKVWFPWDSEGDITADNTYWARVVQPWAGVGWGVQFIPRIGMEVLVAFEDGNIDHPVVIGSVYNGTNTPLFAAADKNQSGIRTRSTTNGGAANYNQLSFDDTMGSEVFYLHAEKDYTLEVENDQTLTIGNDRNVTVTKDETVTIDGKQTVTVKGDQAITVSQGAHSLTVSEGNHTVTVSEGNRSAEVTAGNESLKVDAGSITNEAGQSITLKVGANSIVINTTGITLTVGANSIAMDSSGITLSGTMVTVTGQAKTAVSGAIVQVSGSGELQLSGAILMIN